MKRCLLVSLAVLALAGSVQADIPVKNYYVDFERSDAQFTIDTSVLNTPRLRFHTFVGTNVFDPRLYTARLRYAKTDSSDAMATITGTCYTTYIDFDAQTNAFPYPMSKWYCAVLLTQDSLSYVHSYARGYVNAARSPEVSAPGVLVSTYAVNGSLYGPFTGDFSDWPFLVKTQYVNNLTWLQLADTPASYSNYAGYVICVNTDETGLTYTLASGIGGGAWNTNSEVCWFTNLPVAIGMSNAPTSSVMFEVVGTAKVAAIMIGGTNIIDGTTLLDDVYPTLDEVMAIGNETDEPLIFFSDPAYVRRLDNNGKLYVLGGASASEYAGAGLELYGITNQDATLWAGSYNGSVRLKTAGQERFHIGTNGNAYFHTNYVYDAVLAGTSQWQGVGIKPQYLNLTEWVSTNHVVRFSSNGVFQAAYGLTNLQQACKDASLTNGDKIVLGPGQHRAGNNVVLKLTNATLTGLGPYATVLDLEGIREGIYVHNSRIENMTIRRSGLNGSVNRDFVCSLALSTNYIANCVFDGLGATNVSAISCRGTSTVYVTGCDLGGTKIGGSSANAFAAQLTVKPSFTLYDPSLVGTNVTIQHEDTHEISMGLNGGSLSNVYYQGNGAGLTNVPFNVAWTSSVATYFYSTWLDWANITNDAEVVKTNDIGTAAYRNIGTNVGAGNVGAWSNVLLNFGGSVTGLLNGGTAGVTGSVTRSGNQYTITFPAVSTNMGAGGTNWTAEFDTQAVAAVIAQWPNLDTDSTDDMLKTTYDTDANGVSDGADTFNTYTSSLPLLAWWWSPLTGAVQRLTNGLAAVSNGVATQTVNIAGIWSTQALHTVTLAGLSVTQADHAASITALYTTQAIHEAAIASQLVYIAELQSFTNGTFLTNVAQAGAVTSVVEGTVDYGDGQVIQGGSEVTIKFPYVESVNAWSSYQATQPVDMDTNAIYNCSTIHVQCIVLNGVTLTNWDNAPVTIPGTAVNPTTTTFYVYYDTDGISATTSNVTIRIYGWANSNCNGAADVQVDYVANNKLSWGGGVSGNPWTIVTTNTSAYVANMWWWAFADLDGDSILNNLASGGTLAKAMREPAGLAERCPKKLKALGNSQEIYITLVDHKGMTPRFGWTAQAIPTYYVRMYSLGPKTLAQQLGDIRQRSWMMEMDCRANSMMYGNTVGGVPHTTAQWPGTYGYGEGQIANNSSFGGENIYEYFTGKTFVETSTDPWLVNSTTAPTPKYPINGETNASADVEFRFTGQKKAYSICHIRVREGSSSASNRWNVTMYMENERPNGRTYQYVNPYNRPGGLPLLRPGSNYFWSVRCEHHTAGSDANLPNTAWSDWAEFYR